MSCRHQELNFGDKWAMDTMAALDQLLELAVRRPALAHPANSSLSMSAARGGAEVRGKGKYEGSKRLEMLSF